MNRQVIIGLFVLILSTFLMSCGADATLAEEPNRMVPIQVEMMRKEYVEHTYIAIGEVVPKNQIDLTIGAGSVEGIFIMPGDDVLTDDPLIELDDQTVTSSYTSTESQLRTIRDNLASQYKSAYDNYISQKTLYDSGVISKQALDQSKNQSDNLYRQYNDASVTYKNQLDNLKDSVSDRLLTSPIDGKIAAVYIKEGQIVNNQLAVTIIDDSKLYIKTFISSDLKKSLSLNDQVSLKLDKIEEVRKGSIYQINELPDPQTKLFEMLIQVNDDVDISIGDFSEIEFVIERYEAILVPTQSIVRSGMDQYVYVFDNDEVVKQVVKTGLSKGTWIELKDFNKLEQVVVKGQNQLTLKSEVIVVDGK